MIAETTPVPSFLDRARDGRGNGGFYLLGLLVILLAWLVPVSLLSAALASLFGGTATGGGLGVWQAQVVALLPMAVLLVVVLLTVRFVLGRPARTVITGRERVSWGRMAYGGAVFLGLLAAATAVQALLMPADFHLTFDVSRFLPSLVAVALLMPLQAAAEEVLFRGYVLQWTSLGTDPAGRRGLRGTARVAVLAAVSGLVFALPHLLNPEASGAEWYAWIAWFCLGGAWAWASVLDGRIELAIGAHIANNAFALLLVANAVSVVDTSSVWTTTRIDWPFTLVATAVVSVLFVVVTCRGLRPRAGTS